MPIDDTTLHLLNALLTPGVLGGLGLRWLLQRRNGNGHAQQADIKRVEKLIALNASNSGSRIDGLETRFVTWVGDVEKKQDEDRKVQSDIRVQLARLEGPPK